MDSRKRYYIVGKAQVIAEYVNHNIPGILFGFCRLQPLQFDRESTFKLINALDVVPLFESKLDAHHYARSLRETKGTRKGIFYPDNMLLAPVIEIVIDDRDTIAHIDSHEKIVEKLAINVHTEYNSFDPIGQEEQTVSFRKIQRINLDIGLKYLQEIYFPDSGFRAQWFPPMNMNHENQCLIC